MTPEEVDWGANIDDFPTDDIQLWEFFTPASNVKGESDTVQCRIPPEFSRKIDEMIMDARAKGVPIKTRSDWIRWNLFHGYGEMLEYIKSTDESAIHWLVTEREIAKESERAVLLKSARQSVNGLVQGLQILTHDEQQDWDEARDRISSFLINIFNFVGVQDYLLKLYTRTLFRNRPFQECLSKIEAHVKLGIIIENGRKAYARILDEAK